MASNSSFTKLLKPVLRSAGVRLIRYLAHHGQNEAGNGKRWMKSLLESLGFIVNTEKSLQIATQRIGFIIDSEQMTISLPAQKIKDNKSECRHLLRGKVNDRALQALKIDTLHHHHSCSDSESSEHSGAFDSSNGASVGSCNGSYRTVVSLGDLQCQGATMY